MGEGCWHPKMGSRPNTANSGWYRKFPLNHPHLRQSRTIPTDDEEWLTAPPIQPATINQLPTFLGTLTSRADLPHRYPYESS